MLCPIGETVSVGKKLIFPEGGTPEMAESIHSGHRKRVRKEFLLQGRTRQPRRIRLLNISFFTLSRKRIQTRLHTAFWSASAQFPNIDAPVESLMKVKGISEVSVSLLKLILPVARIYQSEKKSTDKVLDDLDDMGQYLTGKYFGYDYEVFFNALVKCRRQGSGV